MVSVVEREALSVATTDTLRRVHGYPRLRFMGSKYVVMPHLVEVFNDLKFDTVLDAFSGSGVVAFGLKAMGKAVTTNDYLNFAATVACATVENPGVVLSDSEISLVVSGNGDGRDFIRRTFGGLYFSDEDHEFLDAAWSRVDGLPRYKREVAIAGLCLAVARKQPRGVFTVTDLRYDDGRRQMRTSLKELFIEAAREYGSIVFDNGRPNRALMGDIMDIDPLGYDVVYLDPPYVPLKDDNDYIKRYHFLEGLSRYWRGDVVMESTKTKKLPKRFTPFAYKRTITDALRELVFRFRHSTIVLSYSSNSYPSAGELLAILRAEKPEVSVKSIPHRYSFGTHRTAMRRAANEYIFVAR